MKKKYNNLKQCFNKGISTPVGILVVLSVAIVAGLLIWQFSPEEEVSILPPVAIPMPTSTPSPTPSPTPITTPTPSSPDEIADWKTYLNEKYEFEIKYPTNYWLYGDLLLNKETKMFYADPATVNLNKNLTREKGVNNEKIYVNVTEFIKRLKTIKETYDLTGEEDSFFRPLSQEEIIQTKNKLKSAKIGEAIYDLNNKAMGNVIESNGIKMIYSVSFSPQCGYYGAQSIIYSDGNDIIKLYVYLIDAESQTQAENDKYNKIFKQILSTFRFID